MKILLLLILISGNVHPNPGSKHALSISHINMASISIRNPDKVDHIFNAYEKVYNTITLSETWLHSNYSSDFLFGDMFYPVFRKDRVNNSGYGGVLAWVCKLLYVKRRLDLRINFLEAL